MRAARALDDGSAERKFEAICEAQGGRREPTTAAHTATLTAAQAGIVANIDNRQLSKLAKLAGAPRDPAAGVELHAHLGEQIEKGSPLITVHADTKGELQYALNYDALHPGIIEIAAS